MRKLKKTKEYLRDKALKSKRRKKKNFERQKKFEATKERIREYKEFFKEEL